MRFFHVLQFLLFTTLFAACSSSPLDVDLSKVDIPFEYYRMDEQLWQTDFSNIAPERQKLYQKHPEFYTALVEEIYRMGPADSLRTFAMLKSFVQDSMMTAIHDDIQTVFPQDKIDALNTELKTVLQHYKYYFPETKTPKIIYHHSGFNMGVFTMDNNIAIGLDLFMGKNYHNYAALAYPRYRTEKFDSQFLVRDVANDLAARTLSQYQKVDNMLDLLVYYGKIMYLTEAFMPGVQDSVLMRYSSTEMGWAQANAQNVRLEIAKEDVLYSTSMIKNNKWFADGPFTKTGSVPQDSPPRLGIFFGYKMVEAYAKKNSDKSVLAVLNEMDHTAFFRAYKPD